MIKFKTESGTVYYLDDDNRLKREAEYNLRNIYDGHRMDHNPDWEEVVFNIPPSIGERFNYWHPILGGCWSTPVISIEEV